MLAFTCQVCGQLLFFENSVCLRCSTPLGFAPETMDLEPLGSGPGRSRAWRRCANAEIAGCNWLLDPADGEALCRSCRLTRTRPSDGDQDGLRALQSAEAAKRRLLFELLDLRLPVDRSGLRFDLLSSAFAPVSTGHADGLITIDLAEADPAQRERRRTELDEPYRTMLGHFRHEVAHFYWPHLVAGDDATLARYRELYGDERPSYPEALERHYRDGPPEGWTEAYVSAYATMHPWEDWAETFAHYLHIRDALQTGAAYGLVVAGPTITRDPALIAVPDAQAEEGSIEAMIAAWLPFTYALNAVNRSLGRDDLYPFTLAPRVIEKLGFVHDTIRAGSQLAGSSTS